MASVREIAEKVGVSPATVSRALNNRANVAPQLRQKIMGAVNRSRYVPKVGLRSNSNIALVYTGERSIGSPFDAALLQGMSEAMEDRGFDLMILNLAARGAASEESLSNLFLRKGVRGAVLRTDAGSRLLCQQIAAEGFPAVVVGDRFEDPGVNSIYSESRPASREAVQHLIDLGHRRIALAVNVVDDSDHADRTDGYREALRGAGIEPEERMMFRVHARRDGGVQLVRRIRTMREPPTAVYIADPMTAVGAVGEAQRLGLRVPGDLSIIGFDDSDLRFLVHPHMTAVCQDATAMGREAFGLLQQVMDRATGKTGAIRLALPTVLEVHGSTAPPANARPPRDVKIRRRELATDKKSDAHR